MVRQVLKKELGLKVVEVTPADKAYVEGGDVLWTGWYILKLEHRYSIKVILEFMAMGHMIWVKVIVTNSPRNI